MTKTKLEMFRGDTKKLDLTVKQDGAVADVTNWTFWMTAKRDPADADGAAVFQKTSASGAITITNAPLGLVRIVVAPADTADLTEAVTLYYDVQGKDASGGVHTVAYGPLKVIMDATVTTA